MGQKRAFQAGNLTEKIPIIYREPDREYDRELKLNTLKRGLKYPENGGKRFLASIRREYESGKRQVDEAEVFVGRRGEVGKVKSKGE